MEGYSTSEILFQCSATVTRENNVELKRPFLESVFVFLCLLAVCLVYCLLLGSCKMPPWSFLQGFTSSVCLYVLVSSGLDTRSWHSLTSAEKVLKLKWKLLQIHTGQIIIMVCLLEVNALGLCCLRAVYFHTTIFCSCQWRCPLRELIHHEQTYSFSCFSGFSRIRKAANGILYDFKNNNKIPASLASVYSLLSIALNIGISSNNLLPPVLL